MMRLLYILFFLLLHSSVIAENVISPQASVHINKPYYFQGDDVYFKLYIEGRGLQPSGSKVGIAGLYSPDGSNLLQQITISGNYGMASGNFSLKDINKDGYYILRIFYQDHLFTVELPVYQLITSDTELVKDSMLLPGSELKNSDEINIVSDRTSYNARDRVALEITATNLNLVLNPLKYSISVHKNNYLNTGTLLKANVTEYSLVYKNEITGKCLNVETSEILSNQLIVAFFIQSGKMAAAYSDTNGIVSISLDELNGTENYYLQAFTAGGDRINEVKLTESVSITLPSFTVASPKVLKRSISIEQQIEKLLSLNVIKDNYLTSPEKNNGNNISFKPKVDLTIIPDNYYEIASTRDALREIIPQATIRTNKKTDKEQIILRDKRSSKAFKKSPLVLINGIPTIDTEVALSLPLESIESFNLINDLFTYNQFWQMGRYGVLSIKLKKGIKNPLESSLSQMDKASGISENLSLNNTIPDINTPYLTDILTWSSILNVDQKDRLYFPFSDDFGTYLITVVGINEYGEIQYKTQLIRR